MKVQLQMAVSLNRLVVAPAWVEQAWEGTLRGAAVDPQSPETACA